MNQFAWLLTGMAALTFLLRYSLFAWPGLRFPPAVRQALHYVPTSVLSAIVLPGMLLPDGEHWSLAWNNAFLLAGLFCIGISALTRHLLVTIASGLLVFFLLRWCFGQLPI